jgi:YegS/Rv2252/BmrU family lipid kinase
MPRKVVFVVNPSSAGGATGRQWRSIGARFRERLGDFGELFTARPMDAVLLARRALQDGADVVVAVGGDGTINEVANGFFDERGEVIRPGAALAVLPQGTGGDFRRTFRWHESLDATLLRLAEGREKPLDVGRVTFTATDGSTRSRHFVNIASFGSSGLVDRYVNGTTKILGGKASFAIGSLRGMMSWKDRVCRLRFDGGAAEELPITVVAVANGQYFGGGMWVAPQARTDDGVLDVTIWSGYGLLDFVTQSKKIYDGRHLELPGTKTRRARRVDAESDAEVLLDVDGEQPGRLPASFEILPGALRIVA